MAGASGFGYRSSDFNLARPARGFAALGAGIVFGLAHIAHGTVFGISHAALIFFVGAGFFAAAAWASAALVTADIAQAAGFGAGSADNSLVFAAGRFAAFRADIIFVGTNIFGYSGTIRTN